MALRIRLVGGRWSGKMLTAHGHRRLSMFGWGWVFSKKQALPADIDVSVDCSSSSSSRTAETVSSIQACLQPGGCHRRRDLRWWFNFFSLPETSGRPESDAGRKKNGVTSPLERARVGLQAPGRDAMPQGRISCRSFSGCRARTRAGRSSGPACPGALTSDGLALPFKGEN